jgi:hypothetical protein
MTASDWFQLLGLVGIDLLLLWGLYFMACATAEFLSEKWDAFLNKMAHNRFMQTMKLNGNVMINGSYWFSEDPSAVALMNAIGRRIKEEGHLHNMNTLREEWRKEMEIMNNKQEDFE